MDNLYSVSAGGHQPPAEDTASPVSQGSNESKVRSPETSIPSVLADHVSAEVDPVLASIAYRQQIQHVAQHMQQQVVDLKALWKEHSQKMPSLAPLFKNVDESLEWVFTLLEKIIIFLNNCQQLQRLNLIAKLLDDLEAQVQEVVVLLSKIDLQDIALPVMQSNRHALQYFKQIAHALYRPKNVQPESAMTQEGYQYPLHSPLDLKNDLPVHYGATMDNLNVGWNSTVLQRMQDDLKMVIKLEQEKLFELIEQKFKGRDFEKLVAALLRAMGFQVKQSPQGPDGGVDLVAVTQDEDNHELRLCVQVKSSINNTMLSILTQLSGVMHKFKADYGLLVAWGGFEQKADLERSRIFFQIQMWDKHDIVKHFIECYPLLPLEYQWAVPLHKVWALQRMGNYLK